MAISIGFSAINALTLSPAAAMVQCTGFEKVYHPRTMNTMVPMSSAVVMRGWNAKRAL